MRMVVRGDDVQEGNVEKDPQGLTVHAFEADEGDHYETSERAWTDLAQALNVIASILRKKRRDLHLYDPFFCEGASKRHLNNLGFLNVSHQNADFYKTVEDNNVPSYDILTTNPPYSKGHKERTLAFCIASKKPWMLLVPNYVCAAPYFHRVLKNRSMDDRPFFLAPHEKYEFQHRDPKHVSRVKGQSAPFYGWWFMDFPGHNQWFLERCRNVFKGQPVDVYAESEVHEKGLVPYNTRQLVEQIGFHPKGPKQAEKLINMHQSMMANQALFWRAQAMGSLGMRMTTMGSVSAGSSPISWVQQNNPIMTRLQSEGTGMGLIAGMAQRSVQTPMMISSSAGQLALSTQTSACTQRTSSHSSTFLPTMRTRSEPSNRIAGLLFDAVNNNRGALSASTSLQTGGSTMETGAGMLGELTWISLGGANASVVNNSAGSMQYLQQTHSGSSFPLNTKAESLPTTPLQGGVGGTGGVMQQSMPGTALGSPESNSPNLTCHKCRLMGVYQCMCSGELERDLYFGKLQAQYKIQDSPMSFFESSLNFTFPTASANTTSRGISTESVNGGEATTSMTKTTASPAGGMDSSGLTRTSPNDLVSQMQSAAGRNAAAASLKSNGSSGSTENSGLYPKTSTSSLLGWLQKERKTNAKRRFEETVEEIKEDASEVFKKQRVKDWLELKAASIASSASITAPKKQNQERSTNDSMPGTPSTTLCSPQPSMSTPPATMLKFGSDTDVQGLLMDSKTQSQLAQAADAYGDEHAQTKEPLISNSPEQANMESKAWDVDSSSLEILSPIVWTSGPLQSSNPPGSKHASTINHFLFSPSHQRQTDRVLQWPPNFTPGTGNSIQEQSVEMSHISSKQSANSDSQIMESVKSQANNTLGQRSSSTQQQPASIWLLVPPKTSSTSSSASQPSCINATNVPSTSYSQSMVRPDLRNNIVGRPTAVSQNGSGVPQANSSAQYAVMRTPNMMSSNPQQTTNNLQISSNTTIQQAVRSTQMLNNGPTQQLPHSFPMHNYGNLQQPMGAMPLRNANVAQQEITPMRMQDSIVMQQPTASLQPRSVNSMQQQMESKRIQINGTLQQPFGSMQHPPGRMPTQNVVSMPIQNASDSTQRLGFMQMQMNSTFQNPRGTSCMQQAIGNFQTNCTTGPRSIPGIANQGNNLDTSWLLDQPKMMNGNNTSQMNIPISSGRSGAGVLGGTMGGKRIDTTNSMVQNGLSQHGMLQQQASMSLKWLM